MKNDFSQLLFFLVMGFSQIECTFVEVFRISSCFPRSTLAWKTLGKLYKKYHWREFLAASNKNLSFPIIIRTILIQHTNDQQTQGERAKSAVCAAATTQSSASYPNRDGNVVWEKTESLGCWIEFEFISHRRQIEVSFIPGIYSE